MNAKKLDYKDNIFYTINIIIPLLIGAFIYFHFNQESYLGSFFNFLFQIPKLDININSKILVFINNWLCDFLWAYSLFYAMYMSYRTHNNAIWTTFKITVFFAIFVESLQLIKIDFIRCGTFDILDIIIEIIAICISIINLKIYLHLKKGEEIYHVNKQ